MKTIKIFAMPSHTFIDRISGVDYLRIMQPMKYLNGYTDGHTTFQVTTFDPSKGISFDWRDVFQEYDIIYFNYTTNDIGYAVMGTMAQKYGKKLVCDVDDDLWNLLTDNAAYEIFKKGSWGQTVVTAVLGDVHHVTCTNSHLQHSIEYNSKAKGVTVLPNFIDLSLYTHRSTFKDRGYYRALHFGSSTHFASLYSTPFVEAVDRIMKEYPNFILTTVGAFVAEFKKKWGSRYEQGFGDSDLMKWINKMPTFMNDSDFIVTPLLNNVYNRSKSSVKYLEASSFKMPGIYQNIRQYNSIIKNGENGYLASTSEEWYQSMKSLLSNAEHRKTVGENAFKTVEQDWQIQDHVKDYADMFKMVLAK